MQELFSEITGSGVLQNAFNVILSCQVLLINNV